MGGVAVGGDHRELIAAKPRDQVVLAERPLQRMCGGDQDAVSGGVAVAVVDDLEVVEVEQDQYEALAPRSICSLRRLNSSSRRRR